MDRREFLKASGMSAALLSYPELLAACGGSSTTPAASSTSSTISNLGRAFASASSGGAYQQGLEGALVKPVLDKYGIQLNSASAVGSGGSTVVAQVEIQVQSKNIVWDLVDSAEYQAIVLGDKGLLEPIDYKIVDKNLTPPNGAHKHSVAWSTIGRVMAYNTKSYSSSNHPRNWQEFFDVKAFPGRRLFFNSPIGGLMEAALIADGMNPKKLYPLDLDRAFRFLDKVKSSLVPYTTGNQNFQVLVEKQGDLILSLEGRLNNALDAGAPWVPVWRNVFYQRDAFIIPKGALYKDLAMQVIAHALGAKPQAKFTELTGYGPGNSQAFSELDKKYLERFAYSPSHTGEDIVLLDPTWFGANYDKVNERWQAWITK